MYLCDVIAINENYALVQDLLSKNNGVYITPAEYNRYAEMSSLDLFDKRVGARNLNVTAYGRNRTLDRRVNPFRVVTTVTVTAGVATQPADLELTRAVYYTYDGKPKALRVADEDRFAKLFDDPLADPIPEDPFYIEDNGSIRIFPEDIPEVTIEYLKKPVTPVYGYTIVNRRPVYDPASSVDFDWDKREEAELTMRILQYAGVSIAHQAIVQYAEAKQQSE